MKFVVDKHSISDAVSKLSRAVAQRSSVPVLEGILFSAEEGMLTMASYNFEIGIKKVLPIKCFEAGDIVLPAKLLLDIIRKMPSDEIMIEVDARLVCHISCGASHFDIVGIDASDFPEIPSAAGGNELKLPGSMLKAMVRQTVFAVVEESTMPMYTGIYFEVERDYIKLVALDGLRIAIRKETAKNPIPLNFVITGKSINEVFRMIENENEIIEMCVAKNHISFEINGYHLVSRLIDGTYLDYNSVIKNEHSTELRVNTSEVIDAIERISLIINNPNNTPVRCNITEEEIKFTCATTVGRATDSCPIEKNGSNLEFGFNARFMLEALRAAETDEVIMTLNGEIAPIQIKGVSGDDFLYVVMPMRIRND